MVAGFAFAVTAGLLPQALLAGGAVVCVTLAGIRPRTAPSLYRWLSCIVLVGAAAAALVDLYGFRQARLGVGLVAYGGALIVDRFSVLATVTTVILALAAVSGAHHGGRTMHARAGAHHALILIATAAASLLAAEREMIALFATLQLFLVSTSLLIALDKTNARSTEAALKQLMLGAVGSVVLLYGLTLLYGVTGSTDLAAVPAAYAAAPALIAAGVALTLVGLCAALGAVPIHQAVVQVAAGATGPVAGIVISTGVLAGLFVYLRVVVGALGPSVHVALDLTAVIASLTMLYPALMLMRRGSLRRAAGYAILAQTGFMLVGVLSIRQGADHRAGLVALLVYAISVGVTVVACFLLMSILESSGFTDGEGALRGLGHQAGAAGFCLALVLAALGGLPPMAIFVTRLLVVESAVVAGYAWVAVVAAVSTILIAISCIRMIATMYADGGPQRLVTSGVPHRTRAVVGVCTGAALLFAALIQPLLAVSSGGAGTLSLH